jgi:hypothetical protein
MKDLAIQLWGELNMVAAQHVDAFGIIIVLIFVALCIVAVLAQRRADFDWKEAISTNGQLDPQKCSYICFAMAFVWGYVYMVRHDKMTELMQGVFMAFSFGAPVFIGLAQKWGARPKDGKEGA